MVRTSRVVVRCISPWIVWLLFALTSCRTRAIESRTPAIESRTPAIESRTPGIEISGPEAFPRPISPISLGDVTLRRPTLRWELPAGIDGAVVELCRDRVCSMIIETIRAPGTSIRPTNPLPARSVVFWRMRGTAAMITYATYSPTWLFHVPATDATGGVDSSANPHLDVNGDGMDDIVVGAYTASPGGRAQAGTASVFLGSAGGVPMVPARVLEGAATNDNFGISVASAGDVNGDGFGDVVVEPTQLLCVQFCK